LVGTGSNEFVYLYIQHRVIVLFSAIGTFWSNAASSPVDLSWTPGLDLYSQCSVVSSQKNENHRTVYAYPAEFGHSWQSWWIQRCSTTTMQHELM
jgi:hypothetical protein